MSISIPYSTMKCFAGKLPMPPNPDHQAVMSMFMHEQISIVEFELFARIVKLPEPVIKCLIALFQADI